MRVDPTETTHLESFKELRSWTAIDTAGRHRPGGCGKRSRASGIRGGDREPGPGGLVGLQRGREGGVRGWYRQASTHRQIIAQIR